MLAEFLVLFTVYRCAVGLEITGGNETQNLKRNGGFLFTIPKTLVSGKNETVCLSLHEASVPAKAIVDLKWREKHFPTFKSLDTGHTCFDLYVPNLNIKEPQFVGLKVQAEINGEVQSAHNQDPILVYPDKLTKTFVHTDRAIYKPGDKVRFRILMIDERLLPQNEKIPEIKIKNPLDVVVAVWEDIVPENGLLFLEYQLVPEAIIGKWKIEVPGLTKTFDVHKYVLPRYKIELIHPKLIYYKTDVLNITICSRYAYGRPVKGLAFIKVTDSHNNMKPVHKLMEMQDGCAFFNIPSTNLSFNTIKKNFPMYDPKLHVHITATVTEKGTSRIDVTTGKALVYLKPYTIKFVGSSIFQPGLPYVGRIKLSNVNVDVKHEVVRICYHLANKKSWNYIVNQYCSNFSVGDDHAVDFAVLPLKNSVIHINLNVLSMNHTDVGDSYLAVRIFSPTNSHILLQQETVLKESHECRAPEQFKVTFTTDKFNEHDNITFYYMIKSSFGIYKLRKIHHTVRKVIPDYKTELKNVIGEKQKFTQLGVGIDSFTLKYRLDRKIVSKYQLLVYYVTATGETVAASKILNVEPCLMTVNAKWNQKQMVPGATATLNIKVGAHSLCSISAIDKSIEFQTNTPTNINPNSIIKMFVSDERDAPQSGRKSCVAPLKRSSTGVPFDNFLDLLRRKRHVYDFSEDYDAYDVFNKFGTVVVSNLKIVTKPCYNGPQLRSPNQVQYLTDHYDDQGDEHTVSIRSEFPETWIWELVPVSESLQLKRHLPHTITSWVTNVLCVSDDEGLGVSEETEITSFQAFFVEVLTPYTVKREEAFYLFLHISNYLNYKFPIRVTLRLSEGLELVNTKDKLMLSSCLSENNTVTHIFQVRATLLGSVNASVLAEVDDQYPVECGPDTLVAKRDIVLKKILVEPEGYPMKITKSALLCASDNLTSNNVSWSISTPQEIVRETAKGHVIFNADLLGQTIEHLDNLLDVPTGCGEQIVATMAPNLYVLRYLNATNTLKTSIKQRVIRNLKIGYQRILNYVHKDGSFSAFGYHDSAGSMFLTAFAVRTLVEAKQHIYVDGQIIDKAVAWILANQLENGCFNTMLHVFQDMGGTSKENSTASLTAYVIISLLEAGIEVPKYVQTNAKYCIRSQHNPDKYTLALSCYALFKVHWNTEADRMLKRLLALAEQHQNMFWWSNRENISSSTDTEITSYALLSLLHVNTTENLAHAQAVVRWLSSRYSANGGFKTTQDTVVGLDALTRYSRLVTSKNLNLRILLNTKDGGHSLTLMATDQLKSKRIGLVDPNGGVEITVEGDGCVLAQLTHSYYLRRIPKNQAFKLAVDVAPVSTIDHCSIASLSPCLAYTGPDGLANMAVMEVNLPSGYEADRASLYRLIESENRSKVKMFEEQDNKVNLYLTKLDKQLICFTFNINENSPVEGKKDSVIKLFDYYRPEYEILHFYGLNYTCLNNSQHIPEILAKPMSTEIKISNVSDELPPTTERISTKLARLFDILERKRRHVHEKHEGVKDFKPVYKDLNKDFVNLDVNMVMPEGMEANIPSYIKPSKDVLKNMTRF